VISPRRTRLLRVRNLHDFRGAIAGLTQQECPEAPGLQVPTHEIQQQPWPSRLVVVPNAAAARQLARSLRSREVGANRLASADLVTREDLYERLHARLPRPPRRLSSYERDVLAQASARESSALLGLGPAELRPGLVAEMLRFYDQLKRQSQRVARFEELLDEALEKEVDLDRGARRMLEQTHLLAATFRDYERRVADSGACDEHVLREHLLAERSLSPPCSIVVTVADWIAEPNGLYVCDYDLLARLPGLETIDLVATEATLASGFHQRLHAWLPGLDESDFQPPAIRSKPMLAVPAGISDRFWFSSRDREEELIGVARRLKSSRRDVPKSGAGPRALDRVAVVYKQPLPYLYLAQEVFASAGIPYQTADTMPLAAEPFSAALDLVLDFVASSFTRGSMVALLRSPHFLLGDGGAIDRETISTLDRALSEARYLGEFDSLVHLVTTWRSDAARAAALPALMAAAKAAEQLLPLRQPAPTSIQIECLLSFIGAHDADNANESLAPAENLEVSSNHAGHRARGKTFDARERRVRQAIVATLRALATASRAYGDVPVDAEVLTAIVRRAIEDQTFDSRADAPRAGVQLIDDQAARYGDFDEVTVVGLIEGEWPDQPRRNIFYPPTLLNALGWPSEKDRQDAAEARFIDLLASATGRVYLSTITLDEEVLVEPSLLLEDVPKAMLSTTACDGFPAGRIFAEEALSIDPVETGPVEGETLGWAEMRLARSAPEDARFHGRTEPPSAKAWSVSALETYLGCPFKFFAQHVLRLEEEPDDEEVMDPRSQGLFVHKVFEAFFTRWRDSGGRAISSDNLEEARAMFAEVVEAQLRALPETEAALERTRLLGSSAATGLGEAVLRMEAERPIGVVDRLLEYPLRGDFTFQTDAGPRTLPLKGKADRIDLLADGTFRVIDYKLGWPPNRTRALQLPVYALCTEQRLNGHLGRNWTIGAASYLAFKGPRRVVPLFSAPDRERVLREAQERLVGAVDAISRGEFPPRPDDVYRCETCEFFAVCRKDYVGDI
jgi:RecB family exonuclease